MRSEMFKKMASEIAAGIWNELMDQPAFNSLRVSDYVHVLDTVSEVLAKHPVVSTLGDGNQYIPQVRQIFQG